jgi:hypothetical protein
MYNPVMAHENERHEHLCSEPSNERSGKSDESVCLDELVKIDAHQFHCNTKVISEIEMVIHFNNMVFLVRVLENLYELIECIITCGG